MLGRTVAVPVHEISISIQVSHSAVRDQESRLEANARNCGTGSVEMEETIVIRHQSP